jgi:hypothetical protein
MISGDRFIGELDSILRGSKFSDGDSFIDSFSEFDSLFLKLDISISKFKLDRFKNKIKRCGFYSKVKFIINIR